MYHNLGLWYYALVISVPIRGIKKKNKLELHALVFMCMLQRHELFLNRTIPNVKIPNVK
jgi:hypothetical protein